MEPCRIILFIAILFLPFAALASTAGAEPGTVITQADNGKEITVAEGEVFEVRLEQVRWDGIFVGNCRSG